MRARFVVDDDLAVTWSNAAASVFLQETDIFGPEDRSIHVRDDRQRATFRHFIRSSGDAVSSLCLPCRGSDHVLCTATNLINGGRPRKTGLTLRRASSVTWVGTWTLASAFQLTPSERGVVGALFAGKTPEQIGGSLRLSVGTIRVHIKHIYEKLDVRSREAMFHKVLPFMLVR